MISIKIIIAFGLISIISIRFFTRVKLKSRLANILLCSVYTGCGFLAFTISCNALDCNHHWASPSTTVRRYVAVARYNFFLNSRNSSDDWTPDFSEIYPHDYFLAILTFFGVYFRWQINWFADGLVLTNCLVLWVNAAGFRKLLEKDEKRGGTLLSGEVLKNYRTLKDLADLINSTSSHVVLLFMAQALFYYSVSLNDIFTAKNYRSMIIIISFLFTAIAAFFFAGDACRQMEYLGKWLSRRMDSSGDLHAESASRIMQEIKGHEVGISGHWFILDFPAIFNVRFYSLRIFQENESYATHLVFGDHVHILSSSCDI